MTTKPKVFKDMNGVIIRPGDTLVLSFFARWRQRPGNKRVAIDRMSGAEIIVPDEGNLGVSERHWVEYDVKWSGACLIAERGECSDFQVLMGAELFDENGKRIYAGSGFYYMNEGFQSHSYRVIKKS